MEIGSAAGSSTRAKEVRGLDDGRDAELMKICTLCLRPEGQFRTQTPHANDGHWHPDGPPVTIAVSMAA